MKCDNCGEEIEFNGQHYHKHNDSIFCFPNKTATPRKLPGPGEWCTGQQWVDAGGDWQEFVEAHIVDSAAEYFNGRRWAPVTSCASWCDYTDSKNTYRIRLNGKGELPKSEDIESCTALEAEVESWDEVVTCANCKKAVSKAAIEEIYYFCSDKCAAQFNYNADKSEYKAINLEVPLLNPLRIPLGYFIAADKSGAIWAYKNKPEIYKIIGEWRGDNSFPLCITKNSIGWEINWEHSLFTRAEILERWKQEYGDRWLEVAEKEETEIQNETS